ncbi:hypothetical protein [Paramicrobacterium chengjingii]|uniref:hypothetical protein n=1 Tax=Paramicrobacterium chengjingii TaxID=2769067 RepID=UPI00142213C8|nr:hypothetical protein [Microbacterium chengjingii]
MVRITQVSVAREADDLVVSAHISMPGLEDIAWYRLPAESGTDVEAASDAFVIIGLIIAMGSDHKLEFSMPLSARLRYNSRAIQSIFVDWYSKKLANAAIRVPRRDHDAQPLQTSAISCFTGGVDSFYSFVTNQDDIGSLLYIHGFDIPLGRTDLREETATHLLNVASSADKELIEVSTNIRHFLDPAVEWGHVSHGPALATF